MGETVFKTNIKCDGCIAKVNGILNDLVGIGKWSVDVAQPTKPLTINNESVTLDNLKMSLDKVGYTAEPL